MTKATVLSGNISIFSPEGAPTGQNDFQWRGVKVLLRPIDAQ
jgi:hypothetical protein